MDLESDVLALGGVAPTHELLARGHSPEELFAARRLRRIIRPRKGWYVHPSVGDAVVESVRIGGRLACCSAATHHGLWVPDFVGVHVEVAAHASRLRHPADHRTRLRTIEDPGVVVHWVTDIAHGDRRATGVATAIIEIHRCRGARDGFVVFESALRQMRLDTIDRLELIAALPQPFRKLAEAAGHASDSGTESMTKLGMMGLGIRFRQQVVVDGVGQVDFLIGQRLVIEVDSRAHHSDPYRDRRRGAELGIRGYRVLRFMYSQIVHEWSKVEAAILAALSRGDHLAT